MFEQRENGGRPPDENAPLGRSGTESAIEVWPTGTGPNLPESSESALSANAQFALRRIADGAPLNHTHAVVAEVLDRFESIRGTARWGTGIELGAGSAYVSSALSKRKGVERLYVLEASRDYVEAVMPRLFEVEGADAQKLVRVLGSFNAIALPDGSLDFAIAIGALHHSDELSATLAEVSRVLKPGGFLFAVERYQPDNMTDAEIGSVLDQSIPEELARRYGFQGDVPVTRRDLGEHEIRLSEWKVLLIRAGFEIFPFAGVSFSGHVVYSAVSIPWRALLNVLGDRLFLRSRRWQVLGGQIPFDQRWLFRLRESGPVNLLLAARKLPPAA